VRTQRNAVHDEAAGGIGEGAAIEIAQPHGGAGERVALEAVVGDSAQMTLGVERAPDRRERERQPHQSPPSHHSHCKSRMDHGLAID